MHVYRFYIKVLDSLTYAGIILSRHSRHIFGADIPLSQPLFFPFPANNTKIFLCGKLLWPRSHPWDEYHTLPWAQRVSWILRQSPHLTCFSVTMIANRCTRDMWAKEIKDLLRTLPFNMLCWECEHWNLVALFFFFFYLWGRTWSF